ncbi:MAG: hypothetical protein LC118_00295 [Dehalococcoidia bacterium]|nr:hypothetical protein [Dehalococcoidia bacterium]
MKIRTLLLSLSLAAIAAISLTAVACGGDDDSSSSSSSSSDSKPSSGTGGDEQYVATICKAAVKMQDSMDKVDLTKIESVDDAVKAMTGPLDQFIKDIKNAKPPKDAKEYHEAVVKKMSDAVASLKKDKDAAAFGEGFGDMPEPPAAVKERLQKVAKDNADCQKADFTFE